MNDGPRKHRAPFRPVNTLTTPQKPRFQTEAKRALRDDTENDSSFVEERSITHLGDSSSLFEGESIQDSPQYVPTPSPYCRVPPVVNPDRLYYGYDLLTDLLD